MSWCFLLKRASFGLKKIRPHLLVILMPKGEILFDIIMSTQVRARANPNTETSWWLNQFISSRVQKPELKAFGTILQLMPITKLIWLPVQNNSRLTPNMKHPPVFQVKNAALAYRPKSINYAEVCRQTQGGCASQSHSLKLPALLFHSR